jgi:glycosyltransferase involved in cell wall biosynthesis
LRIAIVGIRGIPANYGGFETCAEQTAIRFAQRHEVYTYCRKGNSAHSDDLYRGIHLIRKAAIKGSGIETLSHTFTSVLHLIFNNNIQVVHVYNAANAIFIPLLRLFGKKVVVSVDGLEWKRLKWGSFAKLFYKVSEYISTGAAHVIICDSRVVQRYYERKFHVKTEYIPYGADISPDVESKLLDKYGIQERNYFLFVGRLVPEKGVHNLIKAYNRLKTDMPLVIIGDDPQQKEYVAKLKSDANKNVRFLGFVYGNDYQAINQYPYAYVSASLLEGTSPALVAAMGAGNCVLVNGIEENLETIGEAGLYYKENDIDDLIAKLKRLIENPQEAEEYRQKAFSHVEDNYNWDAIADKYLYIFGSLLGLSSVGAIEINRPGKSKKQSADLVSK